ncbi:hypothetical protein CSUB01_08552 [Colletotrichum sublineola]|uniref:Uncharacterized protein n=1 Tax=Colletotrichum sublineola TaxID=1173701 RepID=A0A066XBR6_COLSU|nr:hypothetical protein CSUB01_08552 [Colletotrichum sublineola]
MPPTAKLCASLPSLRKEIRKRAPALRDLRASFGVPTVVPPPAPAPAPAPAPSSPPAPVPNQVQVLSRDQGQGEVPEVPRAASQEDLGWFESLAFDPLPADFFKPDSPIREPFAPQQLYSQPGDQQVPVTCRENKDVWTTMIRIDGWMDDG